MDNKKNARPGGDRTAGNGDAFDSSNHTPFAFQLKALLIGIAAYDAAVLALLVLIVWGVMR